MRKGLAPFSVPHGGLNALWMRHGGGYPMKQKILSVMTALALCLSGNVAGGRSYWDGPGFEQSGY